MDSERWFEEMSSLGMNLYDAAIYTSQGIVTHRFQPCAICQNCYSVAKVFVMTAIGLLWEEGKLSLSDPLDQYFAKDFPANRDLGWRLATVEHALTHRLGFGSGFLDIDAEEVRDYPTDDYLSIVLSHPLSYAPGSRMQYSDAAFYLLSRLVERVAGESVDRFLRRRLLNAMDFGEIAWSRCPREHPMGATGLYLSSRDVVKLGALYLNGGVYEGRRLLSGEWTELAITHEYELHALTPGGLIGKGGMYGQVLAFSREKGFAVACHAHEEKDHGQELIVCLDHMGN